jgi:hypothetical protein
MKNFRTLGATAFVAFALAAAPAANATPETETSPTGGALPSGVTKVGGLVVDLKGANGARVVSQLAASQMYEGYSNSVYSAPPGTAAGNPLLFGTQSGFSSAVLSALGGGITSASFRITLYDGDTAPGNFDYNQNTFSVNNILVGNWSDVTTYRTDNSGATLISTNNGFGDNVLATGFFTLTDAGKLADLYTSLVNTGALAFTLADSDPGDNYFDFTQGVDGGLINVGQGPVVTPPTGAVPEPATWAMMILGFGMVGGLLRRRRTAVRVTYA